MTEKDAAAFSSGEVCYPLNGDDAGTESSVWRQTLGTDEVPVYNGEIVYQVTLCSGESGYANNAAGHTYGDWTVTKDATCAATGTKTRTCSVCGTEETDEIPLMTHTLTYNAATDATCTEDGTLEYWHCSVCGKYFTDQTGESETTLEAQTLAAKGHTWGEWVTTEESTCTAAGKQTRICSVCNATETQELELISHTLEQHDKVEPTEEKEGNIAYWYCTACEKYFSDEGITEVTDITIAKLTKDFGISDEATLKEFAEKVKEDPTTCGVLTANIDLSGTTWTPIGTKANPYTGTFDGGGYTISGLRVSSSSSGGYVGLFGCIGEGGTVQNVKLKSVSVSSSGKTGYAGALCGYNNGGTIANCTVTGTVSTCGQSGSSGGVCGYNAGTISGCTSSVKVTASGKSAYAGGISGYNAKAGTISSCTSSGAVTTSGKSGKAGGICGYNAGKISSCSSTGKIRATGQSGKSGKIYGYNSGKVS